MSVTLKKVNNRSLLNRIIQYSMKVLIVNQKNYAEVRKKGGGGGGGKGYGGETMKKKDFPVETDAVKLTEYCCGSNIYKEGEDVKLKPESEYPDWLWKLRLGPAPKLEELDPSTKAYWLKVRILGRIRNNRMHKLKYKLKKF